MSEDPYTALPDPVEAWMLHNWPIDYTAEDSVALHDLLLEVVAACANLFVRNATYDGSTVINRICGLRLTAPKESPGPPRPGVEDDAHALIEAAEAIEPPPVEGGLRGSNCEIESGSAGRPRLEKSALYATTSFEEAWAAKEAEGYQYGDDALEQVQLGWELAQNRGPTKALPKHAARVIAEEDITPEDKAIVAHFYKDACHAEWCEFDEMILWYVACRSRLNGWNAGVVAEFDTP